VNRHRFEIPSDIAEIPRVKREIVEQVRNSPCGESTLFDVQLSVGEALANAIVHGNRSDRSRPVTISIATGPDRIRIDIEDVGDGFRIQDVPDPTSPENLERPNGRGIFLMRSCMDQVVYSPRGNRVIMQKRWHPPGRGTSMNGTQRANTTTPQENHGVRILLAEDDDAFREILAMSLRDRGHTVVECRTGIDIVRCISEFTETQRAIDFDLVISDIRMPGVTGLEALEGMRDLDGWPPVILITAFGDRETHEEARRLGAAAMIDKPFEIADLLAAVNALLPGDGD
jgi:CheY-like chemotaxis protein/anti-sigma regulatory factor (Ser/Thr protein kinase)